MNFRNFELDYPKPFHNGKKWVYEDSPIYENLLSCFWNTQHPEDSFKDSPRLRDPFRKINNMTNQKLLGHKEDTYEKVDWVEDKDGVIRACILYFVIPKMHSKKKKIVSFTGREITLSSNDSYIQEIACYPGYEEWLGKLIQKHEAKGNFFEEGTTVIECDMQLKRIRDLLESIGYTRKDNLISSFADMYGFWFKGGEHTQIDPAQEIALQRLAMPNVPNPKKIMEQLDKVSSDFSNHYSNYNKSDSWSGVTVSGYGGEWDFIIKPSEMGNKWKKENPEKLKWKVEDTPLREKIPAVEEYLKLLPYEFERIRILKLSGGEGELQRHTDRQDKEAGISDNQWARVHFPIRTNPKVQFTLWNTDGSKTVDKMKQGEVWYLDMRKPHTAFNGGTEDRYHLVVDLKANQNFRDWMVESSKLYPPTKEADDYIE